MKNLHSEIVRLARLPAVSAATSDLVTSICDMGDCTSATAIITLDYTDPVQNIDFWTSSSDTCIASGTQQTATTNTVQVELASDDDSLQAWSTASAAVTDLTVTSDVIITLSADRLVAVALPNIRRYLAMQFTGTGSSSVLGVTFVGHNSQSGEFGEGPRTAY